MKNSLVTLIMAVYNGEKYLKFCLESICSQTYRNFELIIINDGSTDNSGNICNEYANRDKRFRVIHQENKGCSFARNKGLEIANGEYIGIVDQDDCLHKEYISYFMQLIQKYKVDIATTDTIQNFIGKADTTIKIKNRNIKIWNGIETAEAMLLYTLQIGPWNKLIKRTIIQENNIKFNEAFYCGEGFAFSIECFQATDKVVIGHNNVYFYRIDNATSGSSTFSKKKYYSSLKAQNYMKGKLLDKSKYAKRVLRYSKWKTYSDYYTLLLVSGKEEEYVEEFIEMKKNIRHDAIFAFYTKTTIKQKIRSLMFMISPKFAVQILKFKIDKTTGGKYSDL